MVEGWALVGLGGNPAPTVLEQPMQRAGHRYAAEAPGDSKEPGVPQWTRGGLDALHTWQ